MRAPGIGFLPASHLDVGEPRWFACPTAWIYAFTAARMAARRVLRPWRLEPRRVRGCPQSRFSYMNPLQPRGLRIRECSTRRLWRRRDRALRRLSPPSPGGAGSRNPRRRTTYLKVGSLGALVAASWPRLPRSGTCTGEQPTKAHPLFRVCACPGSARPASAGARFAQALGLGETPYAYPLFRGFVSVVGVARRPCRHALARGRFVLGKAPYAPLVFRGFVGGFSRQGRERSGSSPTVPRTGFPGCGMAPYAHPLYEGLDGAFGAARTEPRGARPVPRRAAQVRERPLSTFRI